MGYIMGSRMACGGFVRSITLSSKGRVLKLGMHVHCNNECTRKMWLDQRSRSDFKIKSEKIAPLFNKLF